MQSPPVPMPGTGGLLVSRQPRWLLPGLTPLASTLGMDGSKDPERLPETAAGVPAAAFAILMLTRMSAL